VESFFETLAEREISYTALRWFETLPEVAPGEDIDLLVADDDVAAVSELLSDRDVFGRKQKVDLYSVTGLPGTSWRGLPYFSVKLARQLLDASVVYKDRYRVPRVEDHFDSLAYHAVYHKGLSSGLPVTAASDDPVPSSPDHAYAAELASLASRLGHDVDISLAGLDAYLGRKGLRPPPDTLERLAHRNPWIGAEFFGSDETTDEVWSGLAVFLVRAEAAAWRDRVARELDARGFEVLHVDDVPAERAEEASTAMRGGNWGPGPWPRSGGEPSDYVVAYDPMPRVGTLPTGEESNLRIVEAKAAIRRLILADVEPARRFNPVHSSDTPRQALHYLELLEDPSAIDRYKTQIESLRESLRFPYPVVRMLSTHQRRAYVAAVSHPELGETVCKVFRPGAQRYFERELRARSKFGDLPEIPEVLESGPNWLLMKYYDDNMKHVARRLPGTARVQLRFDATRRLARLARVLHERGAYVLDLSSQNLVHDRHEGLKVVDLEFLQEYESAPPALIDAYTLRDGPYEQGVDVPVGQFPRIVFASMTTGLPRRLLFSERESLLRIVSFVVRWAWYVLFALRWPTRVVRTRVSRAVRRLRTAVA
jgi:hypothetical protein